MAAAKSPVPRGKVPSAQREKNTKSGTAASEVIKIFGYRARRRTKLQEYLALGIAVVFSLSIGLLAWYTEGRVFSDAWQAVMALEAPGKASRDPGINCAMAKNRNTPYCVNRQQQSRQTWDGITRNSDGRQPAFTLHGRNN